MLRLTKTMSYLAPSILTTSLFVSTTIAMPTQGSLPAASKTDKITAVQIKTEANSSSKTSVLARNTTTKTEAVATTVAPAKKTQDKKTISRCWKRLMNMAREVSHAHRSKQAAN
ncbi:hypothetical protein [Spirosoma sp. KNUC1025]|uniref:hypothetical protein n=1 Tax=Spirosoma sp. KNUC1025 TaxID=2894082 RepID=UPI00386C6384|nr:hypothetical protein LN737_02060 [Spirosoma sp. KNUC1025]